MKISTILIIGTIITAIQLSGIYIFSNQTMIDEYSNFISNKMMLKIRDTQRRIDWLSSCSNPERCITESDRGDRKNGAYYQGDIWLVKNILARNLSSTESYKDSSRIFTELLKNCLSIYYTVTLFDKVGNLDTKFNCFSKSGIELNCSNLHVSFTPANGSPWKLKDRWNSSCSTLENNVYSNFQCKLTFDDFTFKNKNYEATRFSTVGCKLQ